MENIELSRSGTALEKSNWSPFTVIFAVMLTVMYAFAEAAFVGDIHILRIHNLLADMSLSAVAFQMNLLISFLLYLLSMKKWRTIRIGTIPFDPSTFQISLALISLLLCLLMEHNLAVAVYKAGSAIAP